MTKGHQLPQGSAKVVSSFGISFRSPRAHFFLGGGGPKMDQLSIEFSEVAHLVHEVHESASNGYWVRVENGGRRPQVVTQASPIFLKMGGQENESLKRLGVENNLGTTV